MKDPVKTPEQLTEDNKALTRQLATIQEQLARQDLHRAMADMSKEQLTGLLLGCINKKDMTGLKIALKHGADPDATFYGQGSTSVSSHTPLTYPYTDSVAVGILVEGGANPNKKDGLGLRPLMAAIKRCDTSSFSRLIEAGAKADKTVNSNGQTVVHIAAQQKTPDFIYHAKAFNLNARDNRGQTPLMLAVQSGNLDNVKQLVYQGADILIKNNQGQTAEQIAGQMGRIEMASYLADVAQKQDYQRLKDRVAVLESELVALKQPKAKSKTPCKG